MFATSSSSNTTGTRIRPPSADAARSPARAIDRTRAATNAPPDPAPLREISTAVSLLRTNASASNRRTPGALVQASSLSLARADAMRCAVA